MARSLADEGGGTLLNELFAVAEKPERESGGLPYQEISLRTRIGLLSTRPSPYSREKCLYISINIYTTTEKTPITLEVGSSSARSATAHGASPQ
jgi:hypothetical protein